ncbi:MAG: AP2 domain-containing protein [Chloroflexales bacterium]|nr:AP2 domain-containing protein [Chloroflexales bacterium]
MPAPEASPSPAPRTLAASRRLGRRPRQSKSVKHKNLTQVDRPDRKTHGFHVKLGWKGQVYQKWFGDAAYGDRLGALTAALAWRDAKERELGKPRSERTVIGAAASNTGVVGVARVTMKGAPYDRALWRDAEGKMHQRWFSVARLGERRALRAAIKAREQGAALRHR